MATFSYPSQDITECQRWLEREGFRPVGGEWRRSYDMAAARIQRSCGEWLASYAVDYTEWCEREPAEG